MPKSSAMKRGFCLARGVDPDVARVRIGVEEIVAEHLRVEQAHAFLGQRDAVDAGRIERGQIVDADAVHAFERQHRFRCVCDQNTSGTIRSSPVGEIAPQQAGVRAFALQVEFVGAASSRFRRRFRAAGSCPPPDASAAPVRRARAAGRRRRAMRSWMSRTQHLDHDLRVPVRASVAPHAPARSTPTPAASRRRFYTTSQSARRAPPRSRRAPRAPGNGGT